MNCDENTLREMMVSVYGSGVGQCILEKVAGGEPVTIAQGNGITLLLTDVGETLRVLLEGFEWRPEPPRCPVDGSDDPSASYLLAICQRMKSRFTLGEVISHVLRERPAWVNDFAPAWRALILKQRVCPAPEASSICYHLTEAS
jgi:hypothetical protein